MVKSAEFDTKQKILHASSELFSKKGFGGTSIREIANQAGVNLAAVNYHFSNKMNLLQAVIENGYTTMHEAVKEISEDDRKDFVILSTLIFDTMLANGNLVVNVMKIMMSEETKEIENFEDEDENIGPPGGKILFDVLTSQVGTNVPEEERIWAVRTIFGLMFHKVVILSSFACHRDKLKGNLTPEIIRNGVEKLAAVLLNSLQSKSE